MPLITQYHLHVKNHTRHAKSIYAVVAYRSCSVMHDSNTGKTYDYTKKGEHGKLVDSGIILPKGAPEKYLDRQTLWNEIDASESNANARLAREFEVSIPLGLNREQQIEVTKEFCRSLADEGMIVDYAIHNPKADNSNPHIHILCSTRPIDEKTGKFCVKEKKIYALDENGEKIPVIDSKTGKQKIGARGRKIWKRITVQTNPFNAKENIKKWRKQWEIIANNALERAGVNSKIDCRSYEDRGLDIIPCFGEGAEQYIRDRGIQPSRDVRAPNKEIKQVNTEVLAIELSDAKEKALEQGNVPNYLKYIDCLLTYNSYVKNPLQCNLVTKNNELEHDYKLYMAYVGATNEYLKLKFDSPTLQAIYDERCTYFKAQRRQIKRDGNKETALIALYREENVIPARKIPLFKTLTATLASLLPQKPLQLVFKPAMHIAKTIPIKAPNLVLVTLPKLANLAVKKVAEVTKDFVSQLAKLIFRKPLDLSQVKDVLPPLAELVPENKQKHVQVRTSECAPVANTQVPTPQQPEPLQTPVAQVPTPKTHGLNIAKYLQELEELLLEHRYEPLRSRKIKKTAEQKLYTYINDSANFVFEHTDLRQQFENELQGNIEDASEQDLQNTCVTVLLEHVQSKVNEQELNVPKYLTNSAQEFSNLDRYDWTATSEFEEEVQNTLYQHYREVGKFVLTNSDLRSELLERSPSFKQLDESQQVVDLIDLVYDKFIKYQEDVTLYKPDLPARQKSQSRGGHR